MLRLSTPTSAVISRATRTISRSERPTAVASSSGRPITSTRGRSRAPEEDRASDVVALEQLGRAALEPDRALLHEHGARTQRCGDVEALLDEHQRQPGVVQPPDGFHQLLDDDGCQPERELVDAQDLGLEE